MYALVDEDGEITLPQDKKRRSLAMDQDNMQRLRAVTLPNVELMAEAKFPLSPRWLEQLGDKYAMKAAQ
eukprot:818863-Pleurochrysis_carterae.AAC.1